MTEDERKAVFEKVLRLDPVHRLELATRLLDSIEEPESDEWTAAWSAELDRRSQEMRSTGERGSTTAEVMARVRSKLTT